MNSPFSGRRVFLVEDEMFVAWLLEDMLADLGCAVVGPASSAHGYNWAQNGLRRLGRRLPRASWHSRKPIHGRDHPLDRRLDGESRRHRC